MLSLLRNTIGTYTQLSGEGIATVNWEYITQAILLVMSVWLTFKFIYGLLNYLVK